MANIEGVVVTPLKIIADERGSVMHVLRSDAPYFKQFGEVYISTINPGVVKGWKRHSRSTSNMAVPIGKMKFVLRDTRPDSPTFDVVQEVELGEDAYQLLTVPPGVVYGWKSLTDRIAYVINCASELWAPDESQNLPLETYGYSW
ncbi:MAG: dTDP-4-dehydrorhamnose 3,5-epimerase family protein [Patescibacteria group bacterium]